jgi:hypothetical protein
MRAKTWSCGVIAASSLLALPAAAQTAPSGDVPALATPPETVPAAHTADAPAQQSSPSSAPAPAKSRAEAPVVPPWRTPEPAEGDSRWYGWQTLAVDGGALALTVNGGMADSEPLILAGVSAYLVGPMVVHFVHGRPFRGLGSLALRAGLPVAGVAIATELGGPCGGDFGCLGEAVIGAAAGLVSAVALDSAVLAWEVPTPRAQAMMVTPFTYVDAHRALLGVSGSF